MTSTGTILILFSSVSIIGGMIIGGLISRYASIGYYNFMFVSIFGGVILAIILLMSGAAIMDKEFDDIVADFEILTCDEKREFLDITFTDIDDPLYRMFVIECLEIIK
jgi:uncharacterized protein YacL